MGVRVRNSVYLISDALIAFHALTPPVFLADPKGIRESAWSFAGAVRLKPLGLYADECRRGYNKGIEPGMPSASPWKADFLFYMWREDAGHSTSSHPGRGGRSPGRLRKKPKVFAARAAEDSGLSNFPRAISLPGAAL